MPELLRVYPCHAGSEATASAAPSQGRPAAAARHRGSTARDSSRGDRTARSPLREPREPAERYEYLEEPLISLRPPSDLSSVRVRRFARAPGRGRDPTPRPQAAAQAALWGAPECDLSVGNRQAGLRGAVTGGRAERGGRRSGGGGRSRGTQADLFTPRSDLPHSESGRLRPLIVRRTRSPPAATFLSSEPPSRSTWSSVAYGLSAAAEPLMGCGRYTCFGEGGSSWVRGGARLLREPGRRKALKAPYPWAVRWWVGRRRGEWQQAGPPFAHEQMTPDVGSCTGGAVWSSRRSGVRAGKELVRFCGRERCESTPEESGVGERVGEPSA